MIKYFVKKTLSFGTLLFIGSVVFFAIPIAAFEAHVISVTARIENAAHIAGDASFESEGTEESEDTGGFEDIESSPSAEPAE